MAVMEHVFICSAHLCPITNSFPTALLLKFLHACLHFFQYFPSHLNRTRCCLQPICTECFVQIQRIDPSTTVPPSSRPAACPFCVEPDFGVIYTRTSDLPKVDTEEVMEQAATAIGTGGAHATGRVSYQPHDPKVVLVDDIHPNWEEKLNKALETAARQANRRVIMRQEGDNLVPIGVSSSRTGDALSSFISQHTSVGRHGPGGSIILHGNSLHNIMLDYFPSHILRNLRDRDPHRPQIGDQFARTLATLPPEQLEHIMLQETMRISRLEHEQSQRRASLDSRSSDRRRMRQEYDRSSTEPKSRRLSLLPRRLMEGAPFFRFGSNSRPSTPTQPSRASIDVGSIPSSTCHEFSSSSSADRPNGRGTRYRASLDVDSFSHLSRDRELQHPFVPQQTNAMPTSGRDPSTASSVDATRYQPASSSAGDSAVSSTSMSSPASPALSMAASTVKSVAPAHTSSDLNAECTQTPTHPHLSHPMSSPLLTRTPLSGNSMTTSTPGRALLDTPRPSPWAERALQQGFSRPTSRTATPTRTSTHLSPALRDLDGLVLGNSELQRTQKASSGTPVTTNPFRTNTALSGVATASPNRGRGRGETASPLRL